MNMPNKVKPKLPKKKKNLIKMLVEKEISQGNLAKAIGMSSVQVNRIVNGKSKGSMSFWENAAEFLGCEVKDII